MSRYDQMVIEAGDEVMVSGPCHVTGKQYSVTVSRDGYYAWRQGRLIQDALPNVSKEDREFLISGTSPEGWREMFGSDESEDDEDM